MLWLRETSLKASTICELTAVLVLWAQRSQFILTIIIGSKIILVSYFIINLLIYFIYYFICIYLFIADELYIRVLYALFIYLFIYN